jgi:hypothetical protein
MRSHDWAPRSIAQLVGWGLVILGVVLVTGGMVGEGGGASHEPGSDTVRLLIFDSGMGRAALGIAGLGLVALFAGMFMPGDRG